MLVGTGGECCTIVLLYCLNGPLIAAGPLLSESITDYKESSFKEWLSSRCASRISSLRCGSWRDVPEIELDCTPKLLQVSSTLFVLGCDRTADIEGTIDVGVSSEQ